MMFQFYTKSGKLQDSVLSTFLINSNQELLEVDANTAF